MAENNFLSHRPSWSVDKKIILFTSQIPCPLPYTEKLQVCYLFTDNMLIANRIINIIKHQIKQLYCLFLVVVFFLKKHFLRNSFIDFDFLLKSLFCAFGVSHHQSSVLLSITNELFLFSLAQR